MSMVNLVVELVAGVLVGTVLMHVSAKIADPVYSFQSELAELYQFDWKINFEHPLTGNCSII